MPGPLPPLARPPAGGCCPHPGGCGQAPGTLAPAPFRSGRPGGHNTAMSRGPGDQRRRWPVWAARCLWGLVVAAVLIHLIPGQGYRSATSEGGLSQLFVTVAVMVFLLAFATVGA